MPTKTDALLIAIGAAMAIYITWKIPATVATMSTSNAINPSDTISATNTINITNTINTLSGCSKCSKMSIDKISGIDIDALTICRQKGLI